MARTPRCTQPSACLQLKSKQRHHKAPTSVQISCLLVEVTARKRGQKKQAPSHVPPPWGRMPVLKTNSQLGRLQQDSLQLCPKLSTKRRGTPAQRPRLLPRRALPSQRMQRAQARVPWKGWQHPPPAPPRACIAPSVSPTGKGSSRRQTPRKDCGGAHAVCAPRR